MLRNPGVMNGKHASFDGGRRTTHTRLHDSLLTQCGMQHVGLRSLSMSWPFYTANHRGHVLRGEFAIPGWKYSTDRRQSATITTAKYHYTSTHSNLNNCATRGSRITPNGSKTARSDLSAWSDWLERRKKTKNNSQDLAGRHRPRATSQTCCMAE